MNKKVYNVPDEKLVKIIELLRNGENVTMHWLPGGGRTRFALSLHTQESLKQIIPDKEREKLVFLYLDYSLEREVLTTQLFEELGDYTKEETLRERIRSVLGTGKNLVFILDNFTFSDADTLRYLFSLKSISIDRISFLGLQLVSDFDNTEKSKIREFSSALHNIFFVPYFDKKEAKIWMQQKAKKQGIELTKKEVDQIYEFAGGIPIIIKNTLRGYSRIGSLYEAMRSLEMRNIIDMYWTYFTEDEKEFLKTYALTRKVPKDTTLFERMSKSRLINKDEEVGTWINLILGDSPDTKIKRSAEGLIWNDIKFSQILSNSEYDVFLHLFNNTSKDFVSREELGEVIWAEAVAEKYSDWAIDKILSRLRKNLYKAGFDASKIKTLKGKGYRLRV